MSHPFFRRILAICAILLVAVALMVALSVAPAAKSDSASGAVPEKVATAFWLNSGLSLLAAMGCAAIAIGSMRRTRATTSLLAILGLVVLGLGLALTDAASAYRSHEGLLQNKSTLLIVSAVMDFIAGALVVAVALMRSRGKGQA